MHAYDVDLFHIMQTLATFSAYPRQKKSALAPLVAPSRLLTSMHHLVLSRFVHIGHRLTIVANSWTSIEAPPPLSVGKLPPLSSAGIETYRPRSAIDEKPMLRIQVVTPFFNLFLSIVLVYFFLLRPPDFRRFNPQSTHTHLNTRTSSTASTIILVTTIPKHDVHLPLYQSISTTNMHMQDHICQPQEHIY